MQIISIIGSIIAIISYFLITRKNVIGLYGWCISNTIMLVLAIIRKDYGQILLWSIYNILNLYGIYNWSKID